MGIHFKVGLAVNYATSCPDAQDRAVLRTCPLHVVGLSYAHANMVIAVPGKVCNVQIGPCC